MKKIIIVTLAMIIASSALLLAGNPDRIGTAGAQELRIPVGSRGSSLGGALVANSIGAEAIFWNPAGTVAQTGTEAMFSHLEYFADMSLEYVAVATNIEGFGSIGASAKVLSIGDILKTTPDDMQGSSGQYFSPTFSVIGLTYARQFTDRVAFGVSGYFISEKVEQVSASGVAFDFGFTYNPNWRGLKFGIVAKSFGPEMKFDGPNFGVNVIPPGNDPNSIAKTLRSESASFDLPSSVQLGATWNLLNTQELHALEVSSVFQSNNFSTDEFKGGAEYIYNDVFFLRGGFTGSDQNDYMFGPAFGAGLKVHWGDAHLSFDYSWQKTDFFDGDNQYFTVKVSF